MYRIVKDGNVSVEVFKGKDSVLYFDKHSNGESVINDLSYILRHEGLAYSTEDYKEEE